MRYMLNKLVKDVEKKMLKEATLQGSDESARSSLTSTRSRAGSLDGPAKGKYQRREKPRAYC
jgi:hypothetical protein